MSSSLNAQTGTLRTCFLRLPRRLEDKRSWRNVPNAGRWESGCFGAEGVPRRASRTRSISAEFQRKVLILGREYRSDLHPNIWRPLASSGSWRYSHDPCDGGNRPVDGGERLPAEALVRAASHPGWQPETILASRFNSSVEVF